MFSFVTSERWFRTVFDKYVMIEVFRIACVHEVCIVGNASKNQTQVFELRIDEHSSIVVVKCVAVESYEEGEN